MDSLLEKPNITKSRRQSSLPKDQGKVVQVPLLVVHSELSIIRTATPRNQERAKLAQKLTSASNPKTSQAIFIQEQSYPRTSLPSSKQYSRPQKRMSLRFFCYYAVTLTPSRHNRVLEPFPNSLQNGNEGKTNRELNIPLPKAKSSGLRSDGKIRLRIVSTGKNHIRCR